MRLLQQDFLQARCPPGTQQTVLLY